jgi:predicted small secreted protein
MIKRLLFLVFVISLVVLAGCAKDTSDKTTDIKVSATDSAGNAIQDAGAVSEGIEDADAEKQLDDINSSLSNW